jgi:hypothetical protein
MARPQGRQGRVLITPVTNIKRGSMNFNSVFSAGEAPESPEQVQELLKNIIITTNFLPGIRNELGWRGFSG